MSEHPAADTFEQPTLRSVLVSCSLARIDAEVLLAHALGCNRAWLAAHGDAVLTAGPASVFASLMQRRRDGEPIAYLTGRREFWSLALHVDPAVLIPRPETETLVEAVLAKLPADRASRVLDLGTGSGAVALAIARERPRAAILATDCEAAALTVARDNAIRLGLSNVTFAHGDWYRALADASSPETSRCRATAPVAQRFDVIVSNPPYVADGDPHLAEGDLRFEPRAALAAGADGLDALRAIVTGAASHLVPGGWLVVEHGYDQAAPVRTLFAAGGLLDFSATRDLAGVARVAAGRLAPNPRLPPA